MGRNRPKWTQYTGKTLLRKVFEKYSYHNFRAVIDIDDIDVSMQMSCIDIENDISIHIDIVK